MWGGAFARKGLVAALPPSCGATCSDSPPPTHTPSSPPRSFLVRGPAYLKDRIKLPSARPLYVFAGLDIWKANVKVGRAGEGAFSF